MAVVLTVPATTASAVSTMRVDATAYQLNAAHTGVTTDRLSASPAQKWVAQLNGTPSYPLIVGGTVVVASSPPCCGKGAYLYAFNLASGHKEWGPISLGGYFGFAGITADRKQVYAITDQSDDLSTGPVSHAFTLRNGHEKWHLALPGQYFSSAPPTVFNGIVYAAAAESGGTLYAVRAADGHLLWTADVMNGDDSSPAVSSSGVYVSYACEQTYDFNPQTGAQIWHHSTECEGGGGATPVLAGGRLFVRDQAFMDPIDLDAATGAPGGTFTSKTPPAVDGSHLFGLVGSDYVTTGVLTQEDVATGHAGWTAAGDSTLVTAPIVVGGRVFVGGSSGTVFAFDEATGAQVWSADAGSPIPSTGEFGSGARSGLAEGEHTLVVPAGNTLVAYR